MIKMMKWLAGAVLAASLAACGGGGGSPGSTPGGGTGGGNGPITGTAAVTTSVVDGSGNAVTSITMSGTYRARAKVTDAAGAAVSARVVTFEVGNSAVASLSPATALTDSSGVAEVSIAPTSLSASGATTLKASALVGTSTVSGTSDFSVTPTGTPAVAPTVAVSVVDGAGAPVTSLSVGGSFRATAKVTDNLGAPVASKLVTFAVSNGAIATLTPTTALTDASGMAQVSIAPTAITSIGAATVSATATVGTSSVQGTRDFSVAASNLSLSSISLGSTSLPSGGNTPVSVTALIGGTPASATPVNITFSGSCGRVNNQSTFSATTDGSGVASVAYSSVNEDGTLCSGPVTVSAATAGAAPKSATLNVAAPVANAITYVGANPQQIFVRGSGALEQSLVTFRVFAGSAPMTNVAVQLSIVTNPGGVGLNSTGSTLPVTVTTDSQGSASVSVFSGTIPGPVKVRASLVSNSAVFAESQNLTVSSGPPSQRFMSLSAQTFNIEGANRDGSSTILTARLADRQGNPVEDGTVVNFTAEGGQVASSCATNKIDGISQCSVTFSSQNPRLDPNGRFSVLAFASGTKDYEDIDGNNSYDTSDVLRNIGDAYRDDNENGAFDAGEFVVPRGGTASCSGSGGPFPARANTCDLQLATTVRQQAVIVFSSSSPAPLSIISFTTGVLDFLLGSADYPNLPMPAGTAIAAETSGGTCAVDKNFNTTVPNVSPGTDPSANLRTRHTITFKTCATGDVVMVKVTSPSGLVTNIPLQFP